MIIVTGAAGFIGFNIAKRLNLMGIKDLILFDDKEKFSNPKKFSDLNYIDYRHYTDLNNLKNIQCIFHEGACSDTMEYNKDYMMGINYEYSKEIFSIAKSNKAKFIYASSASVYGLNENSQEIEKNESPLNIYAESKLLFDKFIINQDYPAVGLRYFNVYGRGEENKGKMASMAYKMNQEYLESKKISLFKGTGGYMDGEQKRDFIYIDDVVSINMFFMNESFHDVYNVGTGRAESFNEIAKNIFKYYKDEDLNFNYIEMPEYLVPKYQNFTQANILKLREAGYSYDFFNLEEGIKNYLNDLNTSSE
ncbi:MAG: ADP-glyceromanno-heptose 6-epimerase [Gammaproteobacteria bacterium]|nr:ADP-glyceromanno-heptose 6-epimerase [Gammaproteobacteria bacterium]